MSTNKSLWPKEKLGEVVSLEYGKGLPKRKRNSKGKYPVYGSNGIVGFHDTAIVDAPSIIVGRKGAAGEIHFATKNCWPIDTTYFVKIIKEADLRFIFYLLKSLHLSQHDRSTAIPGLNRNDAYDVEILFPPLSTQHRIVEKIEELFSELDHGVENLKKAQQQLKTYRQAVLKDAFEGKLTEEWREQQEGLPTPEELLQQIKAERKAHRECELAEWEKEVEQWEKDGKPGRKPTKPRKQSTQLSLSDDELSNLTELPKGWKWVQFDNVCEVKSNLVDPTQYKSYPHIAPNYIKKYTGQLLEYNSIEEDGVTSPKHLFYTGQIVYSKIRPYLSKLILAPFEGLCSADMYPIETNLNIK